MTWLDAPEAPEGRNGTVPKSCARLDGLEDGGPRRRRPAVYRLITALLPVLLLVAYAAVLIVLWPLAWLGTLVRGRSLRWWHRLAGSEIRFAAHVRAYVWLLTDDTPLLGATRAQISISLPEPGVRIRRRSVLLRPLTGLFAFFLRGRLGGFTIALAVGAWLAGVFGGRRVARFTRAQLAFLDWSTASASFALLLAPAWPRLPEPDTRLRRGVAPGPDAVPLPPWRRKQGWIAIGTDLATTLALQIAFAAIVIGSVHHLRDVPAWAALVGDIAIQAAGPIIAVVLARGVAPLAASQFGLAVLRPRQSLLVALGFAGGYALVLASGLLPVVPFAADRSGIVPHRAHGAIVVVFVALATVVAPVLEEFLYRGFIFQALRSWKGSWTAAAISSIGFAVAHWDLAPLALIDRTALGVGLCYFFARTGRLLPGMYAHSLNNALVLGLVNGWYWQLAPLIVISLALITALAGGERRVLGRSYARP